ncbi:MAG: hypothetical protein QOK15_217 [Nocardioidaceae bacterium]|nr:hypothetical protein [Nocardioidaceae bacterium]
MPEHEAARPVRGRAIAVVLIAVIAAAVAFGLAMTRSSTHEASSLVVAHGDVSEFGSTVGYVTAFRGVLTSDEVLKKVSQQTGVSVGNLRAGLQAEPTEANSISFNVSYRGDQDEAVVKQVPATAAVTALTTLYQPQVASAHDTVRAARSAYQKYQQKLGSSRLASGVNPADAYSSEVTKMSQLQVTLQENQASLNPQYSDSRLLGAIHAARSRAQLLAARAESYQALTGNLDRQAATLATAKTQLVTLRHDANKDTLTSGVLPSTSQSISPLSNAVRAAVAAGVGTFLLGLLVVLALAGRSNPRVSPTEESPEPAGSRAKAPVAAR